MIPQELVEFLHGPVGFILGTRDARLRPCATWVSGVIADAANDDITMFAAALVDDLGKHAVEPDRLNAPALSGEERDRPRHDLQDNTKKVLERLEMNQLGPTIEEFHRFEASCGADGEFGAATEIPAAADIHDALTSPKIYKDAA